jgi:ATP-dependent exoDNAse (exonuclease V) beta subunit
VNVRGRSSLLKINYRTTEEIRKYAFALLKGIDFDDLDDDYDDGRVCQSLTHGTAPKINRFSGAAEELDYLVKALNEMKHKACFKRCLHSYENPIRSLTVTCAGLTARGIRTYEIRRSKLDDPSYDGVRVATMHRVKGLEFRHVLLLPRPKCSAAVPAIIHT